jgi:ribonuclease HI
MPITLVNILTNLLTDRSNQVITNFGLTPAYSVQDGIDQGETITPLLWRIYYDPLIHQISSQYSGYTMSTYQSLSLRQSHKQTLQASTSVLAYMDDTLWITDSKQQLEQIIETASSFYRMANITINPHKSILSSNNSQRTTIRYMDSQISTQPINTAFKFLGCWFTSNCNYKLQTKLITEEINNLTNTLKNKKVTDKQAIYIINTVIIPTFEYRINNIVISQSICNKLLSQYLTVAKHKAGLSKSTPNSTLLNHNIYGVKNVWDIQLQHHITNLLIRINNQQLLGSSTQIRLQQLQNNLWSPTNILQHQHPLIDGKNRHTTTFKIIQLLQNLNMTIQIDNNIQNIQTLTYPHTSIESILDKHPQYLSFKQQLRTKHIMYLEQLTSSDNTILLDWSHISSRINYLPTGRKPKWFSILEQTILLNLHTRKINNNLPLPDVNTFSLNTGHYKHKPSPWLLTLKNNDIIIGKARKYNQSNNTISITHWSFEFDPSVTNLYPTPQTSCNPCLGCSYNSHRIQNKCTFDISATLSTKFLGRKKYSNSLSILNLNSHYLDLLYSIALKTPTNIPDLPSIYIQQNPIDTIFHTNIITNRLNQLANNNITSADLTFYTDGSVTNISTDQCKMSIGWVQIYNNTIQQTFSAPIQHWPSSYKAELIAILSAISTCPRNCKVEIYTDSQSIISKYNKITTQPPKPNKAYSYNYWPIWHTLLNLIKSYSLSVNFYKVTAHSDNTFNNLADSLAKNTSFNYYLDFKHNNLYNPSYFLQLNGINVESPTRRTIKNISNAYNIAMWSSQNRMNQIIPISSQIDWNSTWLYLNNNHKRSYNYTNFQLSHSKSFRVKNIINSLSTIHNLHYLYPHIFNTINCISCNSHEHSLHWVICPNTISYYTILSQTILDTIPHLLPDLSNHELLELQQKLLNHSCLSSTSQTSNNQLNFYHIIRGFIPKLIINTIQDYTTSTKIASNITIKLLLKLSNNLYEQAWKPYCTNLANWKKIHNIPRKIISSTSSSHSPRNRLYQRIHYTYNCICGLPDQKHSELNTCPPKGLANRKVDIWVDLWTKFSVPTNDILDIQI